MEMTDSQSMLANSQMLKDERNILFRTKAHQLAITKYDKSLQNTL